MHSQTIFTRFTLSLSCHSILCWLGTPPQRVETSTDPDQGVQRVHPTPRISLSLCQLFFLTLCVMQEHCLMPRLHYATLVLLSAWAGCLQINALWTVQRYKAQMHRRHIDASQITSRLNMWPLRAQDRGLWGTWGRGRLCANRRGQHHVLKTVMTWLFRFILLVTNSFGF